MILPTDTIVAVADGEKLNVFRNTGTETELSLTAAPEEDVEVASGSGGYNNSSANPDQSQAEENGFASGIVGMLNSRVLTNKFSDIVIIAAPRRSARCASTIRRSWKTPSSVKLRRT